MTFKTCSFAGGLLTAVAGINPCARATEYFVSKSGNDANAGTVREAAWATIQKGVNALQPGDTLTIRPGEYREAVTGFSGMRLMHYREETSGGVWGMFIGPGKGCVIRDFRACLNGWGIGLHSGAPGSGDNVIGSFFATNPESTKRGIGLQPEAFADFHINKADDQPIFIAPSVAGHVHPSICRTKDGTLIVVYKGANVLMRIRSLDGGKTWEPPAVIATSARRPDAIREVTKFEIYPGTADVLPDDRVLVTWNYIADDKARDGYYERALLYAISTDQGRTWSAQGLIGPVEGKHLGAVRHNVLPWSGGRWLLPLRVGSPRLFDPRTGGLTDFPLTGPGHQQHSFQQIVRTAKGTLLAMGPVLLRSTDQGRSWATVESFRAVPDTDGAEGRYLTALTDGGVLVTWGDGRANKGLRYNYSASDGLTWNNDRTVTLLPETKVAAHYYSARTIQLDDRHIGTVFVNGGVYFLKVRLDRVAR